MTYLIRQMGHVAFATPDPEGSAQDLADLVGLKITGRSDAAVFLSSNERRYEVSFTKSADRAVLAIGLEAMDAAAVDNVEPSVRPTLDHDLLKRFPIGYRHLAYFQTKNGQTVTDRILPGLRGPEIEDLYARGKAWLSGAGNAIGAEARRSR